MYKQFSPYSHQSKYLDLFLIFCSCFYREQLREASQELQKKKTYIDDLESKSSSNCKLIFVLDCFSMLCNCCQAGCLGNRALKNIAFILSMLLTDHYLIARKLASTFRQSGMLHRLYVSETWTLFYLSETWTLFYVLETWTLFMCWKRELYFMCWKRGSGESRQSASWDHCNYSICYMFDFFIVFFYALRVILILGENRKAWIQMYA